MKGRNKVNKEAAEAIGTQIKRHRQFQLITQEELAAMAHTSRKMISAFERGQSIPNAIQITEIAVACKTTVEELCDFLYK